MDSVTTYFTCGTAKYMLSYPAALERLPVTNLKKLFKGMFTATPSCVFDNAIAISITRDALEAFFMETKADWGTASSAYVNGYRDPKYLYGKERKATIDSNKRLHAAVKKHKARHQKAERLCIYFDHLDKTYYND